MDLVSWFWLAGGFWITICDLVSLYFGNIDCCTPCCFNSQQTRWYSKVFLSCTQRCSSVCISFSLVVLPASIREKWWAEAPSAYAMNMTPFGAEKWLKEHQDIPGPLWNDYVFGSYLLFALPSRPISIDSRFFPFPPEQMEEYQEISHGSTIWESAFDRDGINLLLLSIETQPKLIENVESSDEWCEQYRDQMAVIFSRCEPLP
jgi:hypothetical protein